MPSRRVLSAEIAHETNTFSVKPTTLASYRERLYYEGNDEIAANMARAKCEIAAHITAAGRFGWELVQPIAARATPSGKTTAEAWAHLKGKVLAACEDGKRFDGVLLALHGAMVTEDADDAEGDLLAELRRRIGPDPLVAITLDLHANVSDAMAKHADIVLAYRTYPHIDQYEIAAEATLLLQYAMDGMISPRAHVARAATIEGCNHGQTQEGAMVRLLGRASQYVASEPDVLAVTVCAGFSLADIPFTGPTVTVIGDGENPIHDDIAADMIAEVWKTRAEVTVAIHSIDEAVGMAKAGRGDGGEGPLVIADFSDNPGSGAYGDSVRLLEAMIAADLPDAALGVICDADAVSACEAAGVGAEVTLALGSKVDASLYGPPLELSATVESLSDGAYVCDGPMLTGEARSMGPTAVLRVGGVRAIVATNNQQVTDRQVFLSQGIDPADCAVVAVKSAHHFRAAFEPGARAVALADTGSLAARDLTRFAWKNVRRPVWPLDEF